MFRLKKDVLKELPPKTYLEIPIELDEKDYAEYKKIEKETIKQIVDGKEVVTNTFGFKDSAGNIKNIMGDDLFPALSLNHFPMAISVIFIIGLISALFPSADGARIAVGGAGQIMMKGIFYAG